MERIEFLRLIDELLELEPGTLKGNEELESAGWTSLAAIGFLALVDEQFGIAISPGNLGRCKTVEDLITLAGGETLGQPAA
jgi:acyl carrier protein